MEEVIKIKGKVLPEPKPRTQRQNYTNLIISAILLILGIHGFITQDTVMIFGDIGNLSHNIGFATLYSLLGIFGIISAVKDINIFKIRTQADLSQAS